MWKIILVGFLACSLLVEPAIGSDDDMKLGDGCESNEDCDDIPHSVCNYDDECECADEFLASPDKASCLPYATKPGDACQVPEQCSRIPFAQCVTNSCIIAQAVTTPPITASKDNCTENSDCSFMKVCKDGACVSSVPTLTPKTFGLDKTIGLPCSNDTDCPEDGATCLDKICRCKEDFVASQNLKSCLPKAKSLGDKCTETTQCVSLNGSICENEKCTDKIGTILKNIGDKFPLLIGSSCQTNNDCSHMNNAVCLENVCQCKDDFVTSITSNSCLAKAKKSGDPCEIYKQCEDIKGSTCVNKKCIQPAVAGFATKRGDGNTGSMRTISNLLAVMLFVKILLF